MQLGRALLFLGLAVAAVGALLMLGGQLGLGKLPGDIVWKGKNFTVSVPIVTSLIISLVLTLLINLFRR